MFCSTIIPTVARPSLERAVRSVLDQGLESADFEVIVVNDSGRPQGGAAWQRSPHVRVIDTNRRERSLARNTGAAVSRGRYLHFLDDDDWLLPGGLAVFQELARQAPEAAWLHGGVRIVDETGSCLAERNSGLQGACLAQVMGGAWVPIQSSLLRAVDFFAVGGYDPFIRGTEDQDLCRRIAARGALANTPAVVACLLRGAGWSTSTQYSRAAEDTRVSGDHVVNQPEAFRRLIDSADSAFWYGRIVHVYLGLGLWCWRRRRFFSSISRTLHALAAALIAGRSLFRRDFWQALGADHAPGSLHFIQLGLERETQGHGRFKSEVLQCIPPSLRHP